MKIRNLFAGVSSIILSALCFSSVSADIAPPLQPPGAIPGPAVYEETFVEMGYESVTIRVQESGDLYYSDRPIDTVNAYVTASFLMFNRGTVDESLDVIFPLTNMEGMGDGSYNYPEVQDLVVKVDDQIVTWEKITTPNPHGTDDPDIQWAQFTAEFPVETVVFIDVSYDLQSTGYFPEATFYYVLETGSGWYGPIPNAHITLQLPYEASTENVLFGDHNMMPFDGKSAPNPEFEGNEVHWEYINLEPDTEDNWNATIIAPHIWQQILDLRESIARHDAGANAKITKWYDALIIDRTVRPGTEGLIPLNLDAYEIALIEDPLDDETLARYANFKLFLYEHDADGEGGQYTLDDIYQMASQALEFDIFNDTALGVISWIENTYDYTPPPTAGEQEVPTQQAILEETSTPGTAQPVVKEKQSDGNSNIWLAVAIGVFSLLLCCVILLFLNKKK